MTLKVDTNPHFGFLCLGGVYHLSLSLTNRHLRSTMKLHISPLSEGQCNGKPHQPGENRLKVFTTHPRSLPPGMSSNIRLVIFAVHPQHFVDTFTISTSTGLKLAIKVSAYILQPDAWVCMLKRLRIEDRPILRPGVHCQGAISKGHHKFLVKHMPHLGKAPVR